MRRTFLKASLVALAVATGLVQLPSIADAATRGGKMVYARYADSLFLDPVLNDANVDIWVLTNLYDTLLQPTADGLGVQPGLATKWDVSGDGKTVTLALRPGVKFADGSALTADDVKWSLDRARDPKAGAWNSSLASIESVSVSGPETVTLALKHPDPTILPALATFNSAILPQKAFEASPGATPEEKAKSFAEKPIGTGPFVMTAWKRGVSMTLKRNPYYWKQGEDGKPLPYLDELEFQIIPDDATRLLKLKAGEIDGTEFIPYARVKELQADPNLRMELWPSTRVRYLTFYCGPTYKDGKPNPVANPKVRQALNYAVNKDAIIQITTLGLGKPMRSFMSATTPLFVGQDNLYKYDLAKAKALLAEAGMANGFDLQIYSLSGNGDDANDLAAVQQMWAQVGVKLRIDQVDNATRTARYREENFGMRTSAWTNDISDPSQITSYFAYWPNIHSLHSNWQDKRVDELFEKSQQEIDPKARAEQYREIQQRYNESAPILYLYETPYPVAFRKNAKGFVQIPLGNNLFEAAYIEK
ncbi:peptide ABC transporter substrate-binding protein [Alsobacter soli]|uniref:Peptide ABC transporter substrate-binding protein n=1 Tax=Alsobacter soli TaxID=2109933 RepID=A0A2T1HME7_9HYPH|nr:ABC transporter substrate-binding protein [Alsobacter soli]PSC02824.1 peptide ABC transporter substrate-binding protein [Alsobacter soli]